MKRKSKTSEIDLSILEHYSRLNILVIGDIMLDRYIQADVERTSPEAPVPVAAVRSEHCLLGGPANVAANIRAMGAGAMIAGVAGKDENAATLRSLLREKGIKDQLLYSDKNRPTTLKTRIISQGQQILRIDREEKTSLSASIEKRLISGVSRCLNRVDGVILSDYAKGVCTPSLVRSLVDITRERNIPIVCDPKGIDFSKFRGVSILTPNVKETQEASGMPVTDGKSLAAAAGRILRITRARAVLITRGQNGVSLFSGKKPGIHIPAHAREVYDVTGAGDTFIAHFAMAYFSGLSLREAASLGNFASAVAVGKLGAGVVSPAELVSFIRRETFTTKFKSLDELKQIVAGLRTAGKKIVFTNGCFDMIHVGHIKFLQEARRLGDCLIVGINTDASVRKVKGEGRPLISETERADLLAALHGVDYVVLFDETTPEPLLRALKPDILVKGKNLHLREVVGHRLVQSYGGKVRRLPFFTGISTSKRLESLMENLKKGEE